MMSERADEIDNKPRLKAIWLMAPVVLAVAVLLVLSGGASADGGTLMVVGESTPDVDGDGDFEFLVLSVSFEAPYTDTYYIWVDVYDPEMNSIYSIWEMSSLETGMNSLELSIPGAALEVAPSDGPYSVWINVYSQTYDFTDSVSYVTGAYAKDDFEAHAALVAPFQESVSDENGNLGYDALRVMVGVDALADGYYTVNGVLTDMDDVVICSAGVENVYLETGLNDVWLSFSAGAISAHGVDGTFVVHSELIWMWMVLDQETQVTGAYASADFERPCVMHGPLMETTYDNDLDGRFDFYELGAYAEVRTPGAYYFGFVLWSPSDEMLTQTVINVWYEPGDWYVSCFLDCMIVIPYGETGPFDLDIFVYDEYWAMVGHESYVTSSFVSGAFEGAGLVGTPMESAPDMNGNGMRDGILVEFEMVTTQEGEFYVIWELLSSGNVITSGYTYIYTGDWVSSSLMIPGSSIYESGVDGPYTVRLTLLIGWYWEDIDVSEIATAAYLASEFDHAFFLPPFAESTVDMDSDDQIEYIDVEVNFNAPAAGFYVVEGLLSQGEMYLGHSWLTMDLPGGISSVTMRFGTYWMIANEADGPYELALFLYVYNPYESDLLVATSAHTTAAYSVDEMEPAASFSGTFSDVGVDLDGAGYYDYLSLSVPLEVVCPGHYYVWSELRDPFGTSIVSSSWDGYLDVGQHVVEQWYTGFFIHEYGYDGPFMVALSLADGFDQAMDFYEYTTGTYSSDDFDHIGFTGAWSEWMVDDDGNGFYNALVIALEVHATAHQDIILEGYLIHPSFAILDQRMQAITVAPGTNILEFRFDLTAAAREQLDGPYYALFFLSSGIGQDDISMETSAYDSSYFDHILFASVPCDRGLDQDMDGLFEYVEIEAEVDSSMEAFCNFEVDVYDHQGNFLTSVIEPVLLKVGLNEIHVRVVGLAMMAYANGEPFLMHYYLYTDFGVSDELIADTMFVYDPAAFESVAWFAGEPTYLLTDHDEDSLFEDLVVQATVHVEFAQWYVITGSLWDQYGFGSFTRVETFLLPGDHEVVMKFYGTNLAAGVQDAPWDVLISLFDESSNWLATTMVRVESCPISQLEPVATITAIGQQGLDVDGDGLYEYLEVEVGLDILVEGQYSVEVMISDASAIQIGRSYRWLPLLPGYQVVNVLLAGDVIRDWGIDGPFILDVYLCDVSYWGISVLDHWIAGTDAFLVSDFEGGTFLSGRDVNTYRLLDTDSDGLYDWLEFQVSIYVAAAGVYDLKGVLYDDDWLMGFSFVEKRMHLKPGWQTVNLRFSGVDIWAKGLTGTFGAELWIMDKSGRVIDERDALTGLLLPGQFESVEVRSSLASSVIQISLKSKGDLVLKVFGSEMVDVSKIDPASVCMGAGISWVTVWSWTYEDCNKDGFLDLVIRFRMPDVRTVVSPGIASIGFQMVYDGVLVEVTSQISVMK